MKNSQSQTGDQVPSRGRMSTRRGKGRGEEEGEGDRYARRARAPVRYTGEDGGVVVPHVCVVMKYCV